jgi:trehalose 6-phosphate synthase
MSDKARVIHVSNRVDIPKPGQATAGGLDEAIARTPQGYAATRIGWSGHTIPSPSNLPPEDRRHCATIDGTTYITSDMSQADWDGFYNGAANAWRWPLFHFRTDIAKPGYSEANNNIATKVNQDFAREVMAEIEANGPATVIVHDYHLIEMGYELRKMGYEGELGFFLHIPAPSADLLEELERPQQDHINRLMSRLFAYDLVGVQAKRDFKNLMSILAPQLAVMNGGPEFFQAQTVKHPRQFKSLKETFNQTQFGVYPVIGETAHYIDRAVKWSKRPEVGQLMQKLGLEDIDGIGVERLDYSKGIPNKYTAIGLCIAQHGVSPNDIHFLQIAPFGRDSVLAYQKEEASVLMAHNMLTTMFGDVATLHEDKVQREVLLALFRQSNFGLVTPLRDGMNLVAFEYIAAQDSEDPGVLILSQFAGAAERLKGAAILVDPRRPEDIARGIMDARSLSLEQRKVMHAEGLKVALSVSNEDWQASLIKTTREAAAQRMAFVT